MGVSDESLGPFGPGNRRFPMPGMVGPSTHLQSPSDAQEELDFTPELQVISEMCQLLRHPE